ncbi:hypothetical protein PV326_013151 [Microctonus aethiopoides]|nr:hypothetical protein PV326_013151 [Microctonus aethiopoides]
MVFSKHVKSLLAQKTSNITESFFALVCKSNNGKITLVTQRGAYGAHIAVAVVVAPNTGAVLSTFQTAMGVRVPETVKKMESERLKKNEENIKAIEKQRKRKRDVDSNVESKTLNKVLKMSTGAEDYDTRSQQPHIALDDCEKLYIRHIAVLEAAIEDVESTE